MTWIPSQQLLSADEIVRVVALACANGVTSVRLTGGEPLIREDVVEIVERISSLPSRPAVAMTTNGIRLAHHVEALAAAGLQRLNISLDTLDAHRFVQLTQRNELHAVISGIEAAIATGITPIKLNAVLMRGINDEEAPILLNWALERGLQLRFIEEMPLNQQDVWSATTYVTAAETIELLRAHFELEELPRDPHSPARLMRVADVDATVGFITSISQPFCGGCDRMRLTADGQFRNCLFGHDEYALAPLLREGADDEVILNRMLEAIAQKKAGHGTDDLSLLSPNRGMNAIGG